MADNNINQDNIPWYQTEAFKTTATILVILMIPVAAFAWNVFSGNGSIKDIQDAFNISSSDTKRDDTSDTKEDEDTTNPNNQANNDSKVKGAKGTKGMPNTPATISYTVVNGDTIESISLKKCGNKNFYLANIAKEISVGQNIKVNCNVYD